MAPLRAVVVAIVIAAASLGGWWLGRHDPGVTADTTVAGATRFAAVVTRAVDGDTVHVRTARGDESVRLLGVNTPETHHPTKGVECFGPEAAAYTARELTGRRVELELDVEHRDLYGRLLAYVVVDGRRFNDVLLEQGYARLLVIPPNGSHGRTMLAEELAARRAHRGLWGAC
ncbi:MAG: thermonuclease family protein [Acidimicrobiia bacterium]